MIDFSGLLVDAGVVAQQRATKEKMSNRLATPSSLRNVEPNTTFEIVSAVRDRVMANNELGEVRRSSVLMNYGPGAIVNFSVGTAPVSVISGGQDAWENRMNTPLIHKRF